MNPRARLEDLVGTWEGTYKLWLEPGTPVRESQTKATVTLVAGGGFASIAYTWRDQGKTHDGVLLVRLAEKPADPEVVWVDSFHTCGGFQSSRREGERGGGWSVMSSYPAPTGPDWGWRTVFEVPGQDEFRILMDNITPDGIEARAVEASYRRAGAAR